MMADRMAMTKRQTNETLRSDMWRACDILRRDNNVGGVMQYTEHLAQAFRGSCRGIGSWRREGNLDREGAKAREGHEARSREGAKARRHAKDTKREVAKARAAGSFVLFVLRELRGAS